MAFTYDDALSTDRDKVRFRIKDTQENAGPRSDGRNFSDNEIAFVLTDEGTVTAAIAHLFEILRAEWASVAMSDKEGDSTIDAKQVTKEYKDLAEEWRAKPGGSSGSGLSSYGLNYRGIDDSGEAIEPMFQRKQFGNEIIDWDASD